MTNIVETDEWKLCVSMEWKAKRQTEQCAKCSGRGEIGGGFKSLDGPMQCTNCFGKGFVFKSPTTAMPEIPAELREQLRRTFWDFSNKPIVESGQ